MKKLLKSNLIFTAKCDEPIDGFVLIDGNRIVKIGTAEEAKQYETDARVYELQDKVICPGFVDNHVFFTGYFLQHAGFDASEAEDTDSLLKLIAEEAAKQPAHKPVIGHCLNTDYEYDVQALEEKYPARPVMVFDEGREFCYMNSAAEEQYGFTAEECWSEQCWRLFKDLLTDTEYASAQYEEFQNLLAERGVTAIKEIGFDHYDGFYNVLKDKEDKNQLKHRVNLVSQPVRASADIEYGKRVRELFDGDKIKFMGYNMMVDGDTEFGGGDLLDGYKDDIFDAEVEVDYEALEGQALAADKEGFRVCLHAEGDRAVRKSIDIYEKCREVNGARDARHAIVDMELIHKDDLARLKDLDISSFMYVQIMNCYGSRENYWDTRNLTEEQQKRVWAYKTFVESGNRLCFATDLPLDVPDILQSIKFASFRLFPDGTPEGGYRTDEALSPAEVLRCWTIEGQKANFSEKELGTLEEGKLADIAVLDTNVFTADLEQIEAAKVCMTIFDGEVVFERN